MSDSDDQAPAPGRPHPSARFRIGVALLALAAVGFVASLVTDGLWVFVSQALWALALPGALLVVYGWRGPDPVSDWPEKH